MALFQNSLLNKYLKQQDKVETQTLKYGTDAMVYELSEEEIITMEGLNN